MTRYLRRVLRRRRERLGPLPLERVRERVSAYVYGAILVLVAIVGAGPRQLENGTAAALVAGTTFSTYLAHVLADRVAASSTGGTSGSLRHELRDAVPIVSAGSVPTLLLVLAATDVLAPVWAQGLAGGVVVLRLVLLGVVSQWLADRAPSWRVVVAGIGLGVVTALVVAVKLVLAH